MSSASIDGSSTHSYAWSGAYIPAPESPLLPGRITAAAAAAMITAARPAPPAIQGHFFFFSFFPPRGSDTEAGGISGSGLFSRAPPQYPQNFAPSLFSFPHLGHFILLCTRSFRRIRRLPPVSPRSSGRIPVWAVSEVHPVFLRELLLLLFLHSFPRFLLKPASPL